MAALASLAGLLTPSFVHTLPTSANPTTAYLDGLRGLASFIVLLCHTAYSSHDLSFGYGYIGERNHFTDTYRSWWRLPYVRLVYDGDAAVAMFFLISGFALSWKPLRLARKGEWASFARTLMSSVLRRWVRLFVPVAASTGIICLAVQLGAYEPTRGIAEDGVRLTAFREPHPSPHANLLVMVGDWASTNWRFWQLFHWDRDHTSIYDIHLWTVPVELRASMGLFVALLATAAMKPRLRQLVLVALIVTATLKDCWGLEMFFAGTLEAELALARGDADPSPEPESGLTKEKPNPARHPYHQSTARVARALAYVLALFLASQPFHGAQTLFWRTLVSYIPASFSETRRFYTSLGCMALFHLTCTSPALRRLFSHPVMQYLGRISFGLYLVHAFLLHTLGYALFAFFWSFTGVETLLMREVGFGLAMACVVPVIICAADLFWRTVDEPSVRLARRVEGWVLTEW